MKDNGTRSRRVGACSSKGVNATGPGQPTPTASRSPWRSLEEALDIFSGHEAPALLIDCSAAWL
jgi:hypothetical protein